MEGTQQFIATTGNTANSGFISVNDIAQWSTNGVSVSYGVTKKTGVAPELYFKYVKKKLGLLEGMKMDSRMKRLELAFNKAVDNGQEFLGEKLMKEMLRETKESILYARGFKLFIEQEDLYKHKRNIKDGHISDTKFKDYTRVIPDHVLANKKKVDDVFDGFVIFHYYDTEVEKKLEKSQKMSETEKSRMRDPVLFGVLKDSTRFYFIDDWEDELCHLNFSDIVDYLGKDEDEVKISKNPKLNV